MNKRRKSTESNSMIALHQRYVMGVKVAMRKLLKDRPVPISKVALMVGMRQLYLPAPPMLESALSYRGTLRFVAFHYSPREAVPVHSDGGDDLPIPNASDWLNFVTHPAICPEIDQCSTLFGRLGNGRILTHAQFEELGDTERGVYCKRFHALVLDREERKLYLAGWEALKMFQPYSQPDDTEANFAIIDGKIVSRGDKHYKAPADPKEVEALIEFLNDQLRDVEVQERLAHWHIHHGRPTEALRILHELVQKRPERRKSPEFQQTLSYLFRQLHDCNAAISAFEEWARASEINAYDHVELGRLYLEAKRYREALDQFQSAKQKEPEVKDAEWYAFEAHAYKGLGDLDRAFDSCRTAMTKYSSDETVLGRGAVHLELADIAALRGELGTAALECRAAIQEGYEDEAEFEESVVVYRPGWWLSADARLANAARCFEVAGEKPAGIHLGRGYLYLAMGRYAEAEEQFRQASAVESSGEAFWFLGVAALALKQRDHAIEIFSEMARRFPRDERSLVGCALVRAAEGNNSAAFEYCDQAHEINAQSGEVRVVMTYLNWSKGNYAEAASEAQKAARGGFRVHRLLVDPPNDHHKDHRYLTHDVEEALRELAVK